MHSDGLGDGTALRLPLSALRGNQARKLSAEIGIFALCGAMLVLEFQEKSYIRDHP